MSFGQMVLDQILLCQMVLDQILLCQMVLDQTSFGQSSFQANVFLIEYNYSLFQPNVVSDKSLF